VPEIFTPVLPGYLHVMQQASRNTYTLAGKLFLWSMIILACIILKNQGYFNSITIDENPRSLNNRLQDEFYRHSNRYEVRAKSGTNATCVMIGMLLIIGGSLCFISFGLRSSSSTNHAVDHLEKGLNNVIKISQANSP